MGEVRFDYDGDALTALGSTALADSAFAVIATKAGFPSSKSASHMTG